MVNTLSQLKSLTRSTAPRYARWVRFLGFWHAPAVSLCLRVPPIIIAKKFYPLADLSLDVLCVDREEIPILEFPRQTSTGREACQVYEFFVEAAAAADLATDPQYP